MAQLCWQTGAEAACRYVQVCAGGPFCKRLEIFDTRRPSQITSAGGSGHHREGWQGERLSEPLLAHYHLASGISTRSVSAQGHRGQGPRRADDWSDAGRYYPAGDRGPGRHCSRTIGESQSLMLVDGRMSTCSFPSAGARCRVSLFLLSF